MKKSVPINTRYIIENADKKYPNLIRVVYESGSIVTLYEKNDDKSKYYFRVIKTENTKDRASYEIEFMPSNPVDFRPKRIGCNEDNFQKYLLDWIARVKKDNEASNLFDDPITQSYYEELGPQFQIIDEKADTIPFNFEQQRLLLEIYEKAKNIIETDKTLANETEAETLISEIETAKLHIPKDTQQQNMNRLRKIVAMAWKYSYNVAKAILAEIVVEVGKKLLIGG